MSGPKSEKVSLQVLQRQMLEREKELQIHKIQIALKVCLEKLQVMEDLRKRIQQNPFIEEISSLYENEGIRETIQEYHKVREKYLIKCEEILSEKLPSFIRFGNDTIKDLQETGDIIIAQVKKKEKELEEKVRFIPENYEKEIRPLEYQIKAFIHSGEEIRGMEAIKNLIDQAKDKEFYQFRYDWEPELVKKIKGMDVTLKKMEKLLLSDGVSEQRKGQMMAIYKEVKELLAGEETPESVITLNNKVREIKECITGVESEKERFEEAYNEYYAYCMAMGEEPKEKGCFSSHNQLDKTLVKMKEDIKEQTCKNYIKTQIEEVMEKHGYQVESAVLRPINKGWRKLYPSMGKNIGMNVFLSEDDQLMMEVVATGEGALTKEDADMVIKEQTAFCRMHPEMLKELEQRGVLLEAGMRKPVGECIKKVNVENNTETMERMLEEGEERKGFSDKRKERKMDW